MDIKDIAKEIRALLKGAFPATKFSVRCKRFSQGSAVDTSWTDGPTREQVDKLNSLYDDGYFCFIRNSRTYSLELVTEAIKLWKEQNPEYAHLAVTGKGDVIHTEFDLSEFKFNGFNGDNRELRFCENSLNKVIRGLARFSSV